MTLGDFARLAAFRRSSCRSRIARRVIAAAPRIGIHTLTLFALSSANGSVPLPRSRRSCGCFTNTFFTETTHCIDEGVRPQHDRAPGSLPATLRQTIADSEAATAKGTRLHLRLAVDYSAREAIYHAACRFYKVTELSPESFSSVLAEVHRGGSTEVDLLIRTGGNSVYPISLVGMRVRGIRISAKTLAGLYGRRSGCGREGIQQTGAHSRCTAGCHRRVI